MKTRKIVLLASLLLFSGILGWGDFGDYFSAYGWATFGFVPTGAVTQYSANALNCCITDNYFQNSFFGELGAHFDLFTCLFVEGSVRTDMWGGTNLYYHPIVPYGTQFHWEGTSIVPGLEGVAETVYLKIMLGNHPKSRADKLF